VAPRKPLKSLGREMDGFAGSFDFKDLDPILFRRFLHRRSASLAPWPEGFGFAAIEAL
jgi:hypothetical protein